MEVELCFVSKIITANKNRAIKADTGDVKDEFILYFIKFLLLKFDWQIGIGRAKLWNSCGCSRQSVNTNVII
jgi:hypothetical protein